MASAVDGELDDRQWQALMQHLQDCENCKALFEQQQEAALQLAGLDPALLEQDLWPDMRDKLQVQHSRSRQTIFGLAALGSLLLGLKLIDIALGDTIMALRIIILILVIAVFFAMRDNPFRLATDQELQMPSHNES
jgi:predicted anti-sigma-YlaC factor YlaD